MSDASVVSTTPASTFQRVRSLHTGGANYPNNFGRISTISTVALSLSSSLSANPAVVGIRYRSRKLQSLRLLSTVTRNGLFSHSFARDDTHVHETPEHEHAPQLVAHFPAFRKAHFAYLHLLSLHCINRALYSLTRVILHTSSAGTLGLLRLSYYYLIPVALTAGSIYSLRRMCALTLQREGWKELEEELRRREIETHSRGSLWRKPVAQAISQILPHVFGPMRSHSRSYVARMARRAASDERPAADVPSFPNKFRPPKTQPKPNPRALAKIFV